MTRSHTGPAPDARLTGIARLIHLNGLPGIGKSSLARSYAGHHPLTLVVDIDVLRTQLGGWEHQLVASQLVARDLAVALVDSHLGAGHDVVVPQYLGRLDFIERLAAVAAGADAEFLEVLLVAEPVTAVARFRVRRAELEAAHPEAAHPEIDVAEDAIASMIGDAARALEGVAQLRSVVRVDASGELDAVCADLLAAIRGADPSS